MKLRDLGFIRFEVVKGGKDHCIVVRAADCDMETYIYLHEDDWKDIVVLARDLLGVALEYYCRETEKEKEELKQDKIFARIDAAWKMVKSAVGKNAK